MYMHALACAAAIAATPASVYGSGGVIDLLPGHPIYHEKEQEAGVVMAIAISPAQGNELALVRLCEELRVAAGLQRKDDNDLSLKVIFIVPYKEMAVEGYYLPFDDADERETLIRGNSVARDRLDDILGRVGIPAQVLDETDVEQEISCEVGEAAWLLRWEDVRPVGTEDANSVISSAHSRFMAIHQSLVGNKAM